MRAISVELGCVMHGGMSDERNGCVCVCVSVCVSAFFSYSDVGRESVSDALFVRILLCV